MKGSLDEFIKIWRKLQMTLGLRFQQRSLTIPASLHTLRPIWSAFAEVGGPAAEVRSGVTSDCSFQVGGCWGAGLKASKHAVIGCAMKCAHG
jgi:hypothetical protein